MKRKPGFEIRNVCGQNIIVATGEENIDYSNIISMNESSAYLWNKLGDKEFTEDDLVKMLEEEYDTDGVDLRNDVKKLIAQWREAEIIE